MKHESRLRAVFIAMASVLIASGLATYLIGAAVIARNHDVAVQRAHISLLEETLSTVKDAETGQRGYLLTGDERYLGPYHSAVSQIGSHLNALADEARNGALSAGDVSVVARLAREKLAELRQTIELRQNNGPDAALDVVRQGYGRQTMENLRRHISAMTLVEENDLRSAMLLAQRYTIVRTLVFAIVSLLDLAFLVWAYHRVRMEMAGRETAALEIMRQKDLIGVTLASIGDAVIVTDPAGQITFINPVAQALTGWSETEAAGQPCGKVFHIINEESREPVESPVDKVLKLGTIVGLANHTLLIRRDGSELPIDDSGAPIRDAKNQIRGVVLVFRDFTEHKTTEARSARPRRSWRRQARQRTNF